MTNLFSSQQTVKTLVDARSHAEPLVKTLVDARSHAKPLFGSFSSSEPGKLLQKVVYP